MSVMVPFDHSCLLAESGFLSYRTRDPKFNGIKALLPVWHFVGSSFLSFAWPASGLACWIRGILVLNHLLHNNSAGLLSIPVMGLDFKINSANHISF